MLGERPAKLNQFTVKSPPQLATEAAETGRAEVNPEGSMTNLDALRTMQRVVNRIRQAGQALDVADLKNSEGANNMVEPKVAKLIQEFDEATNDVAARIERISQNAGISAESAAALEAEVGKLRAMGQDPANPIPDPATGAGQSA